MTSQIELKVSGAFENVKHFLDVFDAIYPASLKSKLLPNRAEEGVHCFVTFDPFAEVKKHEQKKEA